MGYTLAQMRVFASAAQALQDRRALHNLINLRLAMHADARDLQQHIDRLYPDA